ERSVRCQDVPLTLGTIASPWVEDGMVTLAAANAAETLSITSPSSSSARSAGIENWWVPLMAMPLSTSSSGVWTLPANAASTSFAVMLLIDPATRLFDGSVESKNTATEDEKLFTSMVAATPRLGMPPQLTPICSARLESLNGPQSTAVAPFIVADM